MIWFADYLVNMVFVTFNNVKCAILGCTVDNDILHLVIGLCYHALDGTLQSKDGIIGHRDDAECVVIVIMHDVLSFKTGYC